MSANTKSTSSRINGILLILIAAFGLFGQNGITPGPGPTPTPDPPTRLYAVIVEETHADGQSTGRLPEHAAVILSEEVRGLFDTFRVVDKDTSTAPDIKVLVDRAMKDHGVDKLPVLFVIDPDTKHIWYEGALPTNVEEIRRLVNNIKGGHT
jgi:hypothetical protein